MQRIRVLLLFGGESSEHEVSLVSARNVYAALDDRKYDISLGYITREGRWLLVENIESPELGEHRHLLPVLGSGHFSVQPGGRTLTPQVILPILHGANGEDGSVQGLARLLHIPIVGCDVLSSAICMDKEVTKRLLRDAGVPVVRWLTHRAHEPVPDFTLVQKTLGTPFFVKPANAGSSVGVSKVKTEADFKAALNTAHMHDTKVLIEQMAEGREVECSVLGNAKPEASTVGEIKPEGEFYSYESKYAPDSNSEVTIPVDLAPHIIKEVRQIALKAYQVLECRGLARVDFFATDDGRILLNEVNTLPGFTNISMYPKLWRHEGVHYPALIDRLIQLALEK